MRQMKYNCRYDKLQEQKPQTSLQYSTHTAMQVEKMLNFGNIIYIIFYISSYIVNVLVPKLGCMHVQGKKCGVKLELTSLQVNCKW